MNMAYLMCYFYNLVRTFSNCLVANSIPVKVNDSECGQPSARFIPYDEVLRQLVSAWSTSTDRSSRRKAGMPDRFFSRQALYKWQVLRHTEYEAIFITDIDVDFFFLTAGQLPKPGSRDRKMIERAWHSAYELFRQSETVDLIAGSDATVPINTGVMLLKPNASTYALGLSVLRTRRWNVSHGFNYSGSPKEVIPLAHLSQRARDTINGTGLMRHNDWAVTGGDADQGLFAYVYLGLLSGLGFRPVGTRNANGSRPTMFVRHFWAGQKPWLTHVACRQYFGFLLPSSAFRHTQTRCMELLQTRLHHLQARRAKKPKPCYNVQGAIRVF